jgi:predicted transcriptional regulator
MVFWTEQMKLSQIVEALEAKVLTGDDLLEKDIDTCGASDLMSDILAGLSEGSILLTGLTTVQVIRTAMVAGVGAVVFVRGKTPSQEVIDLAREQALPLISSPYSMFVSCGRLHACNLTGLDGRR